jgi:hypothetical protein
MKKMQQKNKRIQIYKIKHKLPSNQAISMANTNFPPQSSKVRSIKGFGENISQLSLCINVSHLNISRFNMVSLEMVSPFKVSHYFVED